MFDHVRDWFNLSASDIISWMMTVTNVFPIKSGRQDGCHRAQVSGCGWSLFHVKKYDICCITGDS